MCLYSASQMPVVASDNYLILLCPIIYFPLGFSQIRVISLTLI